MQYKRKNKNNTTPESMIQTAILNLLQMYQNMGRLYYIRNNSGAGVTNEGRFIRYGRRGSADILVFFKGGITEFWEVKNERGRMTDSQKEFKDTVTALGFAYRIVRSVDEAEKYLALQY